MNNRLKQKTVAEIRGHSCSISINATLDQVRILFERHATVPGVIVVVDQKPLGVISRSKYHLLQHYYTKAGDKLPTLKDLLDEGVITPTRVFQASEQTDLVMAACLQRLPAAVYDPIVVIQPDQSLRLVEMRELLESYKNYCDEIQRETQEAIKHSAEQAMRSQNQFVANMSHEIRTPLTAILGFAENILEGNVSREEMQQAAATIVRNGEHLLSLLNDVLDYAKYQAGKLTIETIPFSLPALLHDVVAVMRLKAETKNIELRLRQAAVIPESVISDPTRIRQILINLVGNAIKFTEKGHVEIHVAFQPEPSSADQGRLVLSVKDSGIGMKRDRMHALFTPFSQADQSTTRKFGGTGLGLTICRRLTKMLDGEMSVKSVFGKGSEFTTSIAVAIPPKTKMVADLTAMHPAAADKSFDYDNAQIPCRVFLAEDSPDNQVLMTGFLQKCGMDVTLAANGQSAYENIMETVQAGQPYDLILMDMQMPILDGFETTARLRRQGVETPIIALTASVLEQDRQHCLEVGCNTLAAKPLNRKRLIAQIRELLPAEITQAKPMGTAGSAEEQQLPTSSRSRPKFELSPDMAHNSKVQRSPFYKSIMGEAETEPEENSNGFASTFATGMFPAPKMIMVDCNVALDRSGNDPELLATITGLILQHCPLYIEELASAVANRDAALTKRLAHTIKGSADNVGGARLSAVAQQLETSATQELWPQIHEEFEELKQLMTPFLNSVRDLQSSLVKAR